MNKPQRVALVHDYIKEYGGAERVLEVLHELYPDAPIFTLVYAPQFLGPHQKRFSNWHIIPSFLQKLPYSFKYISIFRLLAPIVFQTFDFSEFDIIIVSATGAYSPNIIRKKNAKQICYCHTPPRYLYGYKTARELQVNGFLKVCVAIMNHVLRMIDYNASKHVDTFIANSETVAARIKKFYRREAIVIYPPVGIEKEDRKTPVNRDYFLAGGRLARPKHFDLIIASCNNLRAPLKIFGKGFAGHGEDLKKLSGETIEFLGEVSDSEKIELMRNAKAFLFAAEDEDFGIVPVEAMSVGTPVIAFNSGGVRETVISGKTGILFNELTVASLSHAITQLNSLIVKPQDCKKQAEKFAKKYFMEKIASLIKTQMP